MNNINANNLKIITYAFCGIWIVCFFGATDFAGVKDFTSLLYFPKEILNKGAGEGLTMKRLIYFLCISTILYQNRGRFSIRNSKEVFFWNINLLVILLCLVNPNNSFKSIQDIFISHDIVVFVIYLMTLYYVLFLEKQNLILQAREIVKTGILISTIMCLIGLVNYFVGPISSFLFDRHATIQISDILLLLSTFQLIILIKYLNTKQKYLIYIWLLHIIVIFFSLRRTFFFVTIILDFLYLVIMSYPQKRSLLVKVFLGISLLSLIGVFDSFSEKNSFFKERFLSIFSNQHFDDESDKHKGSSGHWEQSLTTTNYLLNNGTDNIFGVGINSSDKIKIPGAFEGYIHNTYVYAWAKYGISMAIFLVLTTLYFLYKSYPLWLLTNRSNHHFLSFVIFVFLVIGWSTPVVTYLLMDITYFIQFLLLLILYRLNNYVDLILAKK